MSNTSMTPGETVKLQQHAQWAPISARLWGGQPPPPKPVRARPVSPFAREVLERRDAAKKQHAEFMRDMVSQAQPSVQPWRRLVADVAAKHHLRFTDIMGKSRSKEVCRARHEVMYRLRREIKVRGVPISFPEIAKRLNMKDHTSAMHGYRKHEQRMREAANPRLSK